MRRIKKDIRLEPQRRCARPRPDALQLSLRLLFADETRQAVAQEMNLSETAFVECLSPEDSFETASRFNLRWFTPTVEVPLCGHATFAAAAALFLGSGNTSDSLTFSTLSGDLHVARTLGDVRRGLGAAARMQMELPCARPDDQVPDGASEMASALCGDLPVEDVRFAASLRYLLVALRPGCVDAGGLGAHKVNGGRAGGFGVGGAVV